MTSINPKTQKITLKCAEIDKQVNCG